MMNELTGNWSGGRKREKSAWGKGKETYRVSITNQCTQLYMNTAAPQTKKGQMGNTHLKFALKATRVEQKAETQHTQLSCLPNYSH